MGLGGSGVLWPALQTHQVAGVTLAPPYSFRADALGFSRLIDTYDQPYQNTGVLVRRDRIHPLADTWLRLLRALRQANLRWYEDPKLAMFVLNKYTKQSDPEVLQKTYEFENEPPWLYKGFEHFRCRPSRNPRLFGVHRPSRGGKSNAERILRHHDPRSTRPIKRSGISRNRRSGVQCGKIRFRRPI